MSAFLWLSLAHANIAVHVRGSSQLVATIAPSSTQDELWIQGQLLDDQGQPIAGAALTIVTSASSSEALPVTPLGACPVSADKENALRTGRPTSLGSARQASSTVLPFNDGTFCTRIPATAVGDNGTLRVEFLGSDAYEGTQAELVAADRRSPLTGSFVNLAHQVSLEDERASFQFSIASVGGEAPHSPPELTIELLLRDDAQKEAERRLRRVTMRVGETTTIALARAELGSPGPAELLMRFEGNDTFRPFRVTHKLTRTIRVSSVALELPQQATTGDRMTLSFSAKSRQGPVEHGALELAIDDGRLLVEPLSPGARVEFVVATPQTPTTLRLKSRYLPSREGYLASAPEEVRLPVVSPSPLRYAIWLIPGLAVLGWLGLSRRNPIRAATEPKATTPPPPRAHVEVIGPPSQRNLSWEGFLVDAHEGIPLPNAHVLVQERGFGASLLIHEAVTDPNGAFIIPAEVPPRSTLELIVRAVHYMEFRTDLPAPGLLRIHLISVRRGLLDRLVEWTKRRGTPYRSKSEPTPDWVAQVARVRGQPEIERWAKAIATAAFREEATADCQDEALLPPAGPAAAAPRSGTES